MSTISPFLAPMSFERGGLLLRPYRAGDGPELGQAISESHKHLRPWLPWADEQYSAERGEETARRLCASYLAGTDFTVGIWLEGKLAGGTGFHMRGAPISTGNSEIGMWIREDLSGKGLGTRVLEAMLEWGFTEWPWERLEWRCDPRNVASARVAEKCGMKLEGTLRSNMKDVDGERRDSLVYAMLKSDRKTFPA